MLQKELAKRLRGRFETEMDGDGWLAVSSDMLTFEKAKNGIAYLRKVERYEADKVCLTL